MKEENITNKDLLEVMKTSFKYMDERFDKMDERFDKMDERFDKMDKRVTKIEATMVTKDYLDEKLYELRGDLVVLTRKEDTKVKTLTNILLTKKVINQKDKDKIFSLEPFPEMKIV